MRMTNVIVNEKGNIKTEARKVIANYVDANRNIFATATKNANGTYTVPVTDEAGNVAYINFTVTVGTKSAADRAEKKATKKEKVAEDFTIEG